MKSKNCIRIKRFPLFLYSQTSFFKVLNILSDDFYISLNKTFFNTNGKNEHFVDICLFGKEKLKERDAEAVIIEIMNSLVSFEKGLSLVEVNNAMW